MSEEHVKNLCDATAFAAAFATFVGWLPAVAAALSIVWTIMRIVNDWDKFYSKVSGWFKM